MKIGIALGLVLFEHTENVRALDLGPNAADIIQQHSFQPSMPPPSLPSAPKDRKIDRGRAATNGSARCGPVTSRHGKKPGCRQRF
jgi:hypothetical protein